MICKVVSADVHSRSPESFGYRGVLIPSNTIALCGFKDHVFMQKSPFVYSFPLRRQYISDEVAASNNNGSSLAFTWIPKILETIDLCDAWERDARFVIVVDSMFKHMHATSYMTLGDENSIPTQAQLVTEDHTSKCYVYGHMKSIMYSVEEYKWLPCTRAFAISFRELCTREQSKRVLRFGVTLTIQSEVYEPFLHTRIRKAFITVAEFPESVLTHIDGMTTDNSNIEHTQSFRD